MRSLCCIHIFSLLFYFYLFVVLRLLQQDDEYSEWNEIGSRRWPPPRWEQERPQEPQRPDLNTYGLSGRLDVPSSPRPPPSSGLNFAVYDPVTRQRTAAVDRNCTATGCCVPKCFAEKGNRVRIYIEQYHEVSYIHWTLDNHAIEC